MTFSEQISDKFTQFEISVLKLEENENLLFEKHRKINEANENESTDLYKNDD